MEIHATKHFRTVNKKPGDCYIVHTRDGNWYPLEFETTADVGFYASLNPDIVKVETVDGVSIYKVDKLRSFQLTGLFAIFILGAFAFMVYVLVAFAIE